MGCVSLWRACCGDSHSTRVEHLLLTRVVLEVVIDGHLLRSALLLPHGLQPPATNRMCSDSLAVPLPMR